MPFKDPRTYTAQEFCEIFAEEDDEEPVFEIAEPGHMCKCLDEKPAILVKNKKKFWCLYECIKYFLVFYQGLDDGLKDCKGCQKDYFEHIVLSDWGFTGCIDCILDRRMKQEAIFTNELGNNIEMKVTVTDTGNILVYAKGPTSVTEHLWTYDEARHLQKLLEITTKWSALKVGNK